MTWCAFDEHGRVVQIEVDDDEGLALAVHAFADTQKGVSGPERSLACPCSNVSGTKREYAVGVHMRALLHQHRGIMSGAGVSPVSATTCCVQS